MTELPGEFRNRPPVSAKTLGSIRQRLVARLEPDVLVLDISMPVLDGIEVAHRLKAAGSGAKLVFLTMHQDSDTARAALATGARLILRAVLGRGGLSMRATPPHSSAQKGGYVRPSFPG